MLYCAKGWRTFPKGWQKTGAANKNLSRKWCMAACIIGRKRWGYTPWSGVEAFKGNASFLSAGLEADRHDVEHSKGSSIHWCSDSLSAQRVLPVTVGRQRSARLAGSPAARTDNRSKKRAKSSMNDYPMRVRQRLVRRTIKILSAKKAKG